MENLVRLATKGLGDLDAHAKVLRELRAERTALEARLRARRAPALGGEERLVEESLANLRGAFLASPERAHATFLALLGGRRMRVAAHPAPGFAVEGIFEWTLENETARNPEGFRAVRRVRRAAGRVAAGRSGPSHPPVQEAGDIEPPEVDGLVEDAMAVTGRLADGAVDPDLVDLPGACELRSQRVRGR
jgi:hypothetical protein